MYMYIYMYILTGKRRQTVQREGAVLGYCEDIAASREAAVTGDWARHSKVDNCKSRWWIGLPLQEWWGAAGAHVPTPPLCLCRKLRTSRDAWLSFSLLNMVHSHFSLIGFSFSDPLLLPEKDTRPVQTLWPVLHFHTSQCFISSRRAKQIDRLTHNLL